MITNPFLLSNHIFYLKKKTHHIKNWPQLRIYKLYGNHILSSAKGFLLHLKVEIKRRGKRIRKKRFTANKAEGKQKAKDLGAPREHTLTKSMAPQTAARSCLYRAGPLSRHRAEPFAFQVPMGWHPLDSTWERLSQ